MKQFILLAALLFFLSHISFSQDHPQRLIYAARFSQDGEDRYDLYDETGKKIFAKPVEWAWSNAWDWIYVGPPDGGLNKVYDHNGVLLLDSVEAWRAPAVNTNRIPLRRNKQWRYYDKSGKQVIDSSYEKASVFTDNKAIIMEKEIVYFIDTNGTQLNMIYKYNDPVYTFKDDDIEPGMTEFKSSNYKTFVKLDKTEMLDMQNKVILPPMYDDILNMRENFKQVTVELDGKYGVVSFSNQILIPIKYEEVYVLNDY